METIAGRDQLLYEQIAQTIGGEVTPVRVERLIKGLREGGHYVHGIKEVKLKPKILESGILPLTPEGRASYWTTGRSVFGYLVGKDKLQSYDTTFFHYAHARDEGSKRLTMLVAITNGDFLSQLGIELSGEYVRIKEPVPRGSIALLEVELPIIEKGRASSQKAEQAMFGLLEKVVSRGYKGGDIISASEARA
jgi:hypothetical protein